jgi:membrane protein implicated in regulation of membrane protease activity
LRGWLGANAFLMAIALISAGVFAILMEGILLLRLPDNFERSATGFAAVISLVATYFLSRWLYVLADRRLNRRH